jgi:hypothetical protein
LRTDKNVNFKFTIKFLMNLERSYIDYLGFLVIDFFKSVLIYSKGAICLSRLLFKMGLFTVYTHGASPGFRKYSYAMHLSIFFFIVACRELRGNPKKSIRGRNSHYRLF